MAKLYLIRRNMDSFAGPLTLLEMRESYKRMAFGLQDEVSGHCGPWVLLDDLPKLKKYYPEVAKTVHENMLAGWGVSDHGEPKTKPTQAIHEDAKRSSGYGIRRHLRLAMIFFVVAVAAFATAVYLAAPGRLSNVTDDAQEATPIPTIEAAQALLDAGNQIGFKQYMTQNQGFLVPQVTKSKKMMNDWLPYMRLLAFAAPGANGEIVGLPPKTLRGPAANTAPLDCSEKTWRRRFRLATKQWSSLASGHTLVRTHWARLLAWDPYWIGRRAAKGWTEPRSYYLGCLMMADKALASLTSEQSPTVADAAIAGPVQAGSGDVDQEGLTKFRQRVQWLLEVARDGRASIVPVIKADDLLAQWSCFEAAMDLKELNRCRDGLSQNQTDEWTAYSEERYNWSVLRLSLALRRNLPNELATLMSSISGKLGKTDFLTGFDYRAEQKMARILSAASPERVMDKALDKLEGEFPELHLAH